MIIKPQNKKAQVAVMQEKTKKEYISIAENFYRTKLPDQEITVDSIWGALLRCAPEYAPNYFNRLKCAVAFHQNSIGNGWTAKVIRETPNPVKVIPGAFPEKASRRAKAISMEKFDKLITYLKDNSFTAECAVLFVIYYTGARPCELAAMKVVDDRIVIKGAKQTEDGKRGADRILKWVKGDVAPVIEDLLRILKNSGKSQDAIRVSVSDAVQKLFPDDKKKISIYTMRHQFGSNLKASGMSRVEMAYMMGHQSTASVARYGDKRRGVAGTVMVKPVADADFSRIRDKAALKIWERKLESVSQESSPLAPPVSSRKKAL